MLSGAICPFDFRVDIQNCMDSSYQNAVRDKCQEANTPSAAASKAQSSAMVSHGQSGCFFVFAVIGAMAPQSAS
jgi:hypothetical protein